MGQLRQVEVSGAPVSEPLALPLWHAVAVLTTLRAALQNPLRRYVVLGDAQNLAWPLVRPAAWLYRRTALRSTRVIAVTGSFGKTTTVRAIATALGCPVAAGANWKTGIALRMFRTPLSQTHCVLEAGVSRPGQMRQFAGMIRPDIAVLSGIGSEHSRSLLTLERTLYEKGLLPAALTQDGLAILNADDRLAITAKDRTRGRVCLAGFSREADVRVEDFRLDWPKGNVLDVRVHGERVVVRTRLVGRHMSFPILAALAVAHNEGVDLELAAERLAMLTPSPSRMELIELGNGAVVVNDAYKASFESYVAAVDAAAEFPAKRRLLVVGDMAEPPGKQSEAYTKLGESFARAQDAWIFHVGKKKQKVQAGAKRAGFPADRIEGFGNDVLEAAARIRERIEPGDLILLKGCEWQKLERIAFLLQGVDVRCGISFCQKRGLGCLDCPMLERGWEGMEALWTRRMGEAGSGDGR